MPKREKELDFVFLFLLLLRFTDTIFQVGHICLISIQTTALNVHKPWPEAACVGLFWGWTQDKLLVYLISQQPLPMAMLCEGRSRTPIDKSLGSTLRSRRYYTQPCPHLRWTMCRHRLPSITQPCERTWGWVLYSGRVVFLIRSSMECIFTDLGLPLVAAGHNLAGDKQGYHIQMCSTSCQGCSYTTGTRCYLDS